MTEFFQNMRNISLLIATCYGLGARIGGAFIASLFALPLVALGKTITIFSPRGSFFFWIVAWVCALIVIQCALSVTMGEERTFIILDKPLGLSLGFLGIHLPFSAWRCIILGIVFFHCLRLLKPFFLLNKTFYKLVMMPNVVGVVASSVIFGCLTNVALRVMLWYFQ